MSHLHLLRGCRPEPLGSYLQGLGVLRLVGEQADHHATGRWTDAGFVLETELNWDELRAFFLDQYAPTPMVSPWNKGAGLRPDGKRQGPKDLMDALERCSEPRFRPYKDAVTSSRAIVERYGGETNLEPFKEQILEAARATLPDAALEWMDAAAVLTTRGPAFAHILGTGGNLGSQDLANNQAEHLDRVIGIRQPADRPKSQAWLNDALFGTQEAPRVKASTGQYDPGNAGGVNASAFDGRDGLVNPWGFVLQLEGALVFASGITRRLGSHGDNVAAMPFTVRPSAAGSGHLSPEENAKGELWLPLWSAPSRADEVRRLFSESRLRWGQRHASTGVDAARAIATLGTDRGIDAFSRNVIAERLGQNPLAVPVGRVASRRDGLTALTGDLDRWLILIRSLVGPPASVARQLRRVDNAMLGVATRSDGNRAETLLSMLEAVASVEQCIRSNRHLRDECPPLPPLPAEPWLDALDDGTPEFAVAAALASSHEGLDDPRQPRDDNAYPTVWRPSVRDYLRGTRLRGRRMLWCDGPGVNVDAIRDVIGAIRDIHIAHATNPRTLDGVAGGVTTMSRTKTLDQTTIESFVGGMLDDPRIGELLRVLVLLDPSGFASHKTLGAAHARMPVGVDPAWRVLAPVFHLHPPNGASSTDSSTLTPYPSMPSRLARGAIKAVIRQALTRIRVARGAIRDVNVAALASSGSRGPRGDRLAAGLMLRPYLTDCERLLQRIVVNNTELSEEDQNDGTHEPQTTLHGATTPGDR